MRTSEVNVYFSKQVGKIKTTYNCRIQYTVHKLDKRTYIYNDIEFGVYALTGPKAITISNTNNNNKQVKTIRNTTFTNTNNSRNKNKQ